MSVWCAGTLRCILLLKCDGTRAETMFRLSAKRTSPLKSAGASVQSTTGSRGVRNSGNNARYTMFRGSLKGTGYPIHSPVSPSLPLPCVTVCHHVSTGLCTRVLCTSFYRPDVSDLRLRTLRRSCNGTLASHSPPIVATFQFYEATNGGG